MNFDNLVDLIVKEVYKKLKEQNLPLSDAPKMPLKKAVVLWDTDTKKYSNLLGEEYDVCLFEKGIRDCDTVIVAKLCLRGLANLASGISVSDEERFILKMMMMGKKVLIIEEGLEYRRYKKTSPVALYNKYIGFENTIKSYGVEVVSSMYDKVHEITHVSPAAVYTKEVNTPVVENITVESANENALILTNKKLITESDLRKPYMNGKNVVVVSKKSIITPLAADFIRINHLKTEIV